PTTGPRTADSGQVAAADPPGGGLAEPGHRRLSGRRPDDGATVACRWPAGAYGHADVALGDVRDRAAQHASAAGAVAAAAVDRRARRGGAAAAWAEAGALAAGEHAGSRRWGGRGAAGPLVCTALADRTLQLRAQERLPPRGVAVDPRRPAAAGAGDLRGGGLAAVVADVRGAAA